MDPLIVFYVAAVCWFSFIVLRIAVLILRFHAFPRTYGRVDHLSLAALAELAERHGRDLPAFQIVVPAYQETLVIDGTLRSLAELNYPRTHFDIHIVTYADEPADAEGRHTGDVAAQVADEINAAAGRALVTIHSVPAGFDGDFPGDMDAGARHIGKPRGLNYVLRRIHEETEREERRFFIGQMAHLGHLDALDRLIAAAEVDPDAIGPLTDRLAPGHPDPVGPLVLSSQLRRLLALHDRIVGFGDGETPAATDLAGCLGREAPRFFQRAEAGADGRWTLRVMEDRRFLHEVMAAVEAEGPAAHRDAAARTLARLARERPRLHREITATRDGERLFQLARRIRSRWVSVYDADADVPRELMRHLAARLLEDPAVMGFQGPVSPVANYEAVHPLCKLGGLWMGFWHSTGYPRLLARDHWAHVLAGTNWCFRIDGIRRGDRLVRNAPYDESRRHFILSFDPRQLTEDLEVAIRIFNDWHLNAAWHPFVEFEQVPDTPRAMIVQRTRWTLGTLQTLGFMLRSRLPFAQKLKYALLPLDIVLSGTGPIVTVLLWILIYTGGVVGSPVLIAWSIFLTVGNLVYVLPYLQAHERFVMTFRRGTAAGHVVAIGPALVAEAQARVAAGGLAADEAALLREISGLIDRSLARGGALRLYLATRSLEDPGAAAAVAALRAETPTALDRDALETLGQSLAALAERGATAGAAADPALLHRLAAFRAALEKCAALGPWARLRRRERRQIWLWSFVYLFYQLIPYYRGLIHWLRPCRTTTWNKTPRTRKSNLPADGYPPAPVAARSSQMPTKR